eukprot:gene28887-32079_t
MLVLTVTAPTNGPMLDSSRILITIDTIIGEYTDSGGTGLIKPTSVLSTTYPITSWGIAIETLFHGGPLGNPLQLAMDLGAGLLHNSITPGGTSPEFTQIAQIPCGSVISIAIDPDQYDYPLPPDAPPNAGMVYQYACEADPNSVPVVTISVPSIPPPPGTSPSTKTKKKKVQQKRRKKKRSPRTRIIPAASQCSGSISSTSRPESRPRQQDGIRDLESKVGSLVALSRTSKITDPSTRRRPWAHSKIPASRRGFAPRAWAAGRSLSRSAGQTIVGLICSPASSILSSP